VNNAVICFLPTTWGRSWDNSDLISRLTCVYFTSRHACWNDCVSPGCFHTLRWLREFSLKPVHGFAGFLANPLDVAPSRHRDITVAQNF